MAPKTKRKGKKRDTSASGTSSDESDQKKAQGLINKLSMKYMRKAPKENQDTNSYDGDSERSADTANYSDASMKSIDQYEFNEPDDLPLRLPLSPQRGNKKAKTLKEKKNISKKEYKGKKLSQKGDCCPKRGKGVACKKSDRSLTVDPMQDISSAMEESGIEISYESGNQTSSRLTVAHHELSNISCIKKSITGRRTASGIKLRDSGQFISPPPVKLVKLSPKDACTSTPSIPAKTISQTDDDCFGFDSLRSPPPALLVSPVKRVPSVQSDYGSMVQSTSRDMTSSIEGEDQQMKAVVRLKKNRVGVRRGNMLNGYKRNFMNFQKLKALSCVSNNYSDNL